MGHFPPGLGLALLPPFLTIDELFNNPPPLEARESFKLSLETSL